jgi:hypothetical protein
MANRIDRKPKANKTIAAMLKHGPVMHMFIAEHDFSIFWRGCTLHYQKGRQYTVEDGLKATISETDRAVTWES